MNFKLAHETSQCIGNSDLLVLDLKFNLKSLSFFRDYDVRLVTVRLQHVRISSISKVRSPFWLFVEQHELYAN